MHCRQHIHSQTTFKFRASEGHELEQLQIHNERLYQLVPIPLNCYVTMSKRRLRRLKGEKWYGLTCWKRAFLCLGLVSSYGRPGAVGGSSSGCGAPVRAPGAAAAGAAPAPAVALPPLGDRLTREPRGDPSPCEPFAHNTLPSPDALFRTPLYPDDTPPPPALPPLLPSRGFTYKFDESFSHAMSPSEGKGCVRHDANVSAM